MKVMVLGGSGMWGHQVFVKMTEKWGRENVACTLHKSRAHYNKIPLFQTPSVFENVDFRDFEKASQVLKDYKPDWIINCVGLTPRKFDTKDHDHYYQINSELPHKLAWWAQENAARLIHFSTDCVFSGKKGDYTEEDIPDAADVYGRSKALGELRTSKVLTYRLSKVGREIEGKTEIVEWLLSQKGKSVQGFSKAMYSGLTTNAMADELIRIVENFPELTGLYQISSEKISKYELLKKINQIYNCGIEVQEKSDYAVDKSLNCDLYSKLTGFKKPSWQDMLQKMKVEERINYG